MGMFCINTVMKEFSLPSKSEMLMKVSVHYRAAGWRQQFLQLLFVLQLRKTSACSLHAVPGEGTVCTLSMHSSPSLPRGCGSRACSFPAHAFCCILCVHLTSVRTFGTCVLHVASFTLFLSWTATDTAPANPQWLAF